MFIIYFTLFYLYFINQTDIDLLAGFVEDEGSLMAGLISPAFVVIHLNLEYFTEFVDKANSVFHNVDVPKVTQFYLSNVDQDNSTALKLAMYKFIGDLMMKCPTYLFAKRYAERSSSKTNVFLYELTHSPYLGRYGFEGFGVHHMSEVELAFGHPFLFPNTTSDESTEYSKEIMKFWTDFAKNG